MHAIFSAIEACSWRDAIQIHVYLTLPYVTFTCSDSSCWAHRCCDVIHV